MRCGSARRGGARGQRVQRNLDGRKVYKWVDEHGVTHYGDQIPPEYAAQEHQVINAQGIEIEHTDAQKTPEQLAAEEQKEDRCGAARQPRPELAEHLCVGAGDRTPARPAPRPCSPIRSRSPAQFLETLNGKMNKLRVSSARFKPYSSDPKAPPMPDQVAEDLVRVGSDIHTQEENLREKRSEEATMSKQFESDIDRFKELKGIH